MTSNPSSPTDLPPLAITCTSTDCEHDLHCYKQKKKRATGRAGGPCRDCGADLVDWERVHARNINDVAHTFAALKTELIRHHYWHEPFDERAINHARRKGRTGMREAAENRLRTSVGPAQPFRDGTQTPKDGNALFYAQHATATCCRTCLEVWYGIPKGRDLTDDELGYLTELVLLYVWERLPDLKEDGERVPTRRQRLVGAEREQRSTKTQKRTNHDRRSPDTPVSRPGTSAAPSAQERLLAAMRRKRPEGDT